MTRHLVLSAWVVVAAGVLTAEVLAAARPARFASLDQLLQRVTRSMAGRVIFLLGWLWVGWHFFAR